MGFWEVDERAMEDMVPCRVLVALGVLNCERRMYPCLRGFLWGEGGGSRVWRSLDELLRVADGIAVGEDGTFGDCIRTGLESVTSMHEMSVAVDRMRSKTASAGHGMDLSCAAKQLLRGFVASYDTLSFEAACAVRDRAEAFVQGAEVQGEGGTKADRVRASFEAYLTALDRREYSEAEDAVHRYFDLALVSLSLRKKDASAEFANGAQYASLSIAAAQHQFGYHAEAAAALNEAVNVAQQVGDEDYQRKAAGWLAEVHGDWRLLRANQGDPEAELALARQEIETLGLGASPQERLSRVQRHVAAATGKAGTPAKLVVTGLLLLAAAWILEGGGRVALSLAQLALKRSSAPSLAKSELPAQARSSVEALRFDAGEPIDALAALFAAAKSLPNRSALIGTATDLSFRLALARGELRVAEALADRIASLQRSELHLHAALARGLCLLHRGDLLRADRLAAEIAHTAARQRRTSFVIEALMLQAEVHLAANAAASALPPVLSALSFTAALHNEPLRCRASGLLAQVHLGLGAPSDALRVVRSVLPIALHALPIKQQADLHLVHAECMLRDQSQTRSFGEILRTINSARTAYSRADDTRGKARAELILAETGDAFQRIAERDEAVQLSRIYKTQLDEAANKSPREALAALDDVMRT